MNDSLSNQKVRKQIASVTSEFLKTRLILSQEILKADEKECMSLQQFIDEVERMWKSAVPKESIDRFIAQKRHCLVINDHEIDELCSLVNESLEKYCIGDFSCFSEFPLLIEIVLSNMNSNLEFDDLLTHDEKEERYFNIYKWKTISSNEKKYGVDYRVQGSFSWGEGSDFSIHDIDGTCFAKIGLDGEKMWTMQNNSKEESDYLLAKNLFIGKAEESCEMYDLFLEKKDKAAIYYKQLYHDITDKLKRTNERKEAVMFSFNINDFFDLHQVSYLKENYYEHSELKRALLVVNNFSQLTESEKEQIEEVVSSAAEYWKNVVEANILNNEWYERGEHTFRKEERLSKDNEEKVELFEKYLKDEIRADLIAYKESSVNCKYEPCHYLRKSLAKTGLNVMDLYGLFQSDIHMHIRENEIKITKSFQYKEKEEQIIDCTLQTKKNREYVKNKMLLRK